MTRSSLPARTGRTSLTDDELLLFDFMFDVFVPLHVLTREAYPIHMNVGYTHQLEDEALNLTIQNMQERGLIRSRRARGRLGFTLSPQGGRLWSIERQPLWKKYLRAEGGYAGAAREKAYGDCQLLVIASPTKAVVNAYLSSALQAGLHVALGEFRAGVRDSFRLVPWKRPSRVYTMRGLVKDPPQVQWALLEQHRCWWKNVSELATLIR